MINSRGVCSGLALALAIALLGSAGPRSVASEAAKIPLKIDLQVNPMPARVGIERVTVTVRDTSGALVNGAVVLVLPSYATVAGGHTMTMSGMGRGQAAVRAVGFGDGAYHADVHFTKVTHWALVVHVGAAQTQTTITRNLEVR